MQLCRWQSTVDITDLIPWPIVDTKGIANCRALSWHALGVAWQLVRHAKSGLEQWRRRAEKALQGFRKIKMSRSDLKRMFELLGVPGSSIGVSPESILGFAALIKPWPKLARKKEETTLRRGETDIKDVILVVHF